MWRYEALIRGTLGSNAVYVMKLHKCSAADARSVPSTPFHAVRVPLVCWWPESAAHACARLRRSGLSLACALAEQQRRMRLDRLLNSTDSTAAALLHAAPILWACDFVVASAGPYCSVSQRPRLVLRARCGDGPQRCGSQLLWYG
jgi:hypothetical protein